MYPVHKVVPRNLRIDERAKLAVEESDNCGTEMHSVPLPRPLVHLNSDISKKK